MTTPPRIDELKNLHQKKYRDEYGYFLAEGEHLVLELEKAMRTNSALGAARVFASQQYMAEKIRLPVHRLSARQIEALSDTRTPQGVVAVVPILQPPAPKAGERVVYLHEIQDPGNLGTILRTFAWFGGFRCLLSPNSVDPYNSKVVRASMGAIFHVPIERDVTLEVLSARCPRLAVLDTRGATVSSAGFRDCDGYVFGNEARGLPAEVVAKLRASTFCIPGGQLVESLNLAAAVNICAYELMRG